MSNKTIAIEVGEYRYEIPADKLVLLEDFSELFREAGFLEEDQVLRGVTKSESYMLDR